LVKLEQIKHRLADLRSRIEKLAAAGKVNEDEIDAIHRELGDIAEKLARPKVFHRYPEAQRLLNEVEELIGRILELKGYPLRNTGPCGWGIEILELVDETEEDDTEELDEEPE
jgi:hypothetical protein